MLKLPSTSMNNNREKVVLERVDNRRVQHKVKYEDKDKYKDIQTRRLKQRTQRQMNI